MKRLFLSATMLAAILVACNKNDDEAQNQVNSTDQSFVAGVSASNSAEVAAGQLAATKGTNVGVKAYGQMMVTEHTQAQTDLKSLGTNVNIAVKDSIDPPHVLLMQRLNTLTGYSFDTAYMNSQIRDHRNTLSLFQTEVSSGSHQRVKAYANQYQPAIQLHLNRADSLRAKL